MKQFVKFSAKLFVIVVLFFVLFAYAMFQGGFVSWFLFYSMLPIIVYMFLLLLYPLKRWKVERNISRYALEAGGSIDIQLTIKRKIPFPLYYCIVEEYVPETMDQKGSWLYKYRYMKNPQSLYKKEPMKLVSFPWFKRTFSYPYHFKELPRGEHHFSQVRVKTGDFFGFVKKEVYFNIKDSVLVYPHKRNLVLTSRVNSFDEGASPAYTMTKKDTSVVTGVREYMPGDRFSWIDWKTTAKKNVVMTKEFEQQKSTDVVLVLDASMDVYDSSIAFEGCVELTASLMNAYKKSSSQVAVLSIGKKREFFPFSNDYSQQRKIDYHLARIQPSGRGALANALYNEQRVISQKVVTFLITRKVDHDTKTAIKSLQQRSTRVVLFYINANANIQEETRELFHELTYSGVIINVLTEENMTQHTLEVST